LKVVGSFPPESVTFSTSKRTGVVNYTRFNSGSGKWFFCPYEMSVVIVLDKICDEELPLTVTMKGDFHRQLYGIKGAVSRAR